MFGLYCIKKRVFYWFGMAKKSGIMFSLFFPFRTDSKEVLAGLTSLSLTDIERSEMCLCLQEGTGTSEVENSKLKVRLIF